MTLSKVMHHVFASKKNWSLNPLTDTSRNAIIDELAEPTNLNPSVVVVSDWGPRILRPPMWCSMARNAAPLVEQSSVMAYPEVRPVKSRITCPVANTLPWVGSHAKLVLHLYVPCGRYTSAPVARIVVIADWIAAPSSAPVPATPKSRLLRAVEVLAT